MNSKHSWLTYALLGLCIIVGLGTNLGGNRDLISNFLISNSNWNGHQFLPEVFAGQYWRLITPIFLHFSEIHIIFNGLWLWQLGRVIELLDQAWKLGAMVLTIGLLSNLAQYMFAGPLFGGMSGVVYGLLGYVWAQGKFNPRARLILNPQITAMMMIWFVVCWTGLVGNIANMAHTVGLLVGVIWGWLEAVNVKNKMSK
ncbi:MAG: rhomboid family intramembrane serine protease [Gammaproteobacteria bacterium]|nr:rhomboid family intramembrane serine protease [Gammaproteobacteria bacterium]MDH5777787.1 rhomboid family intramembrane serine protease [Gammaproteobacteria bacterium]